MSQIEGDVRGKDDKRIFRAVVIVLDTTMNVIDSTSSGEDGFYSFTNLKPGKYFIEAKAKGFENRLYKNVIVWKNVSDPKKGEDQSYATRLQIVLFPAKPKQ
jgi:Carboxypeptidase regulatory-like domain